MFSIYKSLNSSKWFRKVISLECFKQKNDEKIKKKIKKYIKGKTKIQKFKKMKIEYI